MRSFVSFDCGTLKYIRGMNHPTAVKLRVGFQGPCEEEALARKLLNGLPISLFRKLQDSDLLGILPAFVTSHMAFSNFKNWRR